MTDFWAALLILWSTLIYWKLSDILDELRRR